MPLEQREVRLLEGLYSGSITIYFSGHCGDIFRVEGPLFMARFCVMRLHCRHLSSVEGRGLSPSDHEGRARSTHLLGDGGAVFVVELHPDVMYACRRRGEGLDGRVRRERVTSAKLLNPNPETVNPKPWRACSPALPGQTRPPPKHIPGERPLRSTWMLLWLS